MVEIMKPGKCSNCGIEIKLFDHEITALCLKCYPKLTKKEKERYHKRERLI